MKKIMLLGGSAQQVVAIETAKRLGYYTVLCDYLPDNPGQYHADKFYLESTTDMDRMFEIAKEENIDGILAYASDPAAPTAAYIGEKLGLPTNPYRSVEILCNKDKFRAFLKENGFPTPEANGYTDANAANTDLQEGKFQFPVIVKPVDSSGSKGVTILRSPDGFSEAVRFAFSFSRSGKIIIERYIVCKHKHTIGGDIFVDNGRVIIWGLMSCFREHSQNPLVPGGEMYPALLDKEEQAAIKRTLQDMVTKLQVNSGCINVELMIDNNDDVYMIDIGPRAGGNMIPIQLSAVFGVDIVEMSIKAAMGEKLNALPKLVIPYCATYVIHSDRGGTYTGIDFSEEIENNTFRKELYVKPGDTVECFDNAAKAMGIIFLKFSSVDEMLDKMNHMNEHIKVRVQ